MPELVDPRAGPQPRVRSAVAAVAESIDQIEELHRLCREGRIYDVEDWIKAGRPLQFSGEAPRRGRKLSTALEIALETGQHGLALLLLCNGYRLDLEPGSPFNLALKLRRGDLLDLVWSWGADPTEVDPYTLFETYDSALFERFYAAGADLTSGHEMADTLAYRTSNRPLFGFAKRHRESDPSIQMELNIALAQHVEKGNLRGLHLCLWAGADPHVPAPDLHSTHLLDTTEAEEEGERFLGWSAVERAVMRGDTESLRVLKPDPARDNWQELYQSASDGWTCAALAAIAPPGNVGPIIRHQVFWLEEHWRTSGREPVGVMEHAFKAGGRWVESPVKEIAAIRRGLLKAGKYRFVEVMKLLAQGDHCSPAVLQELGRTPSIRQRMVIVGLLPSPQSDHPPWGYDPHRVPGSRNISAKFGIVIAKPKRPLPRVLDVGWRHRDGTTIRLDRRVLYERVWAEPVEPLATSWGLSGRGLAKVCRRLQIPVPPRGYWAKIQHGQKQPRPSLRDIPGGNPVEIVIHVPPKSP